jgi:hypothetical protein
VGSNDPWFITDSIAVLNQIRRFNLEAVSPQSFMDFGGDQAYDWTNMYTNLPQQEVIQRICDFVITPIWVFACHHVRPRPCLKVYLHKDEHPVWYPSLTIAISKNLPHLVGGIDDDAGATRRPTSAWQQLSWSVHTWLVGSLHAI